jgi:hypothetical protein
MAPRLVATTTWRGKQYVTAVSGFKPQRTAGVQKMGGPGLLLQYHSIQVIY